MILQTMQTRILGSVIALAGTMGLALAAQAGEPASVPPAKYDDVVVRYADLNLNSSAGAKVLYARLSSAATRACGGRPTSASLAGKAQFNACYERTLNRAVQKVGSRQVQTLHSARTDATLG